MSRVFVKLYSWSWCNLPFQVPEYEYPKDSVPDYLSILVPNVDNVRTDFLIDVIAKQGKAVLLIGEQVSSSEKLLQTKLYDMFIFFVQFFNSNFVANSDVIFQGTAKTVMVQGYANKYNPEAQMFKSFNFSSASTPLMFQVTAEIYFALLLVLGV